MSLLGLDISTSIIGWCYLEDDGIFRDIGYIDLRKCLDLYEKLDMFMELVDKISSKDAPIIYVEEPLKMFMKNQSMAQTIALLQRFNGMCCATLHNRLDIQPKLINPMTARSTCGIKVPRGFKTKEYVLQQVRERGIIPDTIWEMKRTGNPKDYCFDQADAWVVANAGVIIEKRIK